MHVSQAWIGLIVHIVGEIVQGRAFVFGIREGSISRAMKMFVACTFRSTSPTV